MRKIKWTQWDSTGMVRCGEAEYGACIGWLREMGTEARECLRAQEKAHAVYGRKMYNEEGDLKEIRFYQDAFMTDEELDKAAREAHGDIIYAAHRR